jgi:flagellar biosynthetic protein FlhB
MSQNDEDTDDKPHEATPRKLDEARERGELPRSADLAATAGMAGFLALALFPAQGGLGTLAELGRAMLDRAEALGDAFLGGGTALGGATLAALGVALAPAALVPAALVLALLLAMRGLVFASEKLEPKASRLSIVQNAKQKFGRSGLFEFAKSAVKLVVYCVVLWLYLAARLPVMLIAIAHSPGQVTGLMLRLMVEFMVLIVLVMGVIGAVDYLFQHFDHLRQQRMSHRELMDEIKTSEGDPYLKQARRAKAESIATNQMLADVPKASVVIVNPTHYAVALRWSPEAGGAPVCVAKGVDEIALRIRERAREAGVPIHSDPATARALHAGVRIGEEVRAEHYAPVAAAIRFAEAMRQRARKGGRSMPPKAPR